MSLISIASSIGNYYSGGGGSTYSAQYQAVLDYAALKGYSPPDDAGKAADDALIQAAIVLGLWDASARFYNHHTNGDSDYACIDYKNPSDATNALKVNSPSYAIKTGFTGNGSSSYLNYQFIPNSDGAGLYTLTDGSLVAYSAVNIPSGSQTLFGVGSTTSRIQLSLNITSTIHQALNDNSLNTFADADVVGLWRLKRTPTTTKQLSKNGIVKSTNNVAAVALPTSSLVGLANNFNGAIVAFFPGRIDCMIIGKGTTINDSNINNMWDIHRTNVAAL